MAASLVVLRRLARTTLSSAPSLVRGSLKRALASKAGGGELVQKQQPKDLVSVLQRELAFEREDGEAVKTLEELRQTLAGEWTILDTPGTSRVALTKKHGSSTVRVDLDCTPMPSEDDSYPDDEEEGAENEDEEDEDQEAKEGFRVLVTIDNAKGHAMRVGCFVTDHMRIHRVSLHDADKLPSLDKTFAGVDESPSYAGPNFEELDQALQNAYYDLLHDRGVNDQLCQSLADYAAAKEQLEYVRFLESCHGFAKSL